MSEQVPAEVGEVVIDIERRILRAFARGAQPRSVLADVCLQIEEWFDRDVQCSVLILEEGVLRHGAAPSLPDEYIAEVDGLAIGPDQGACGAAVYAGESVHVEDASVDSRWADFRDLVERFSIGSCWATPVRDHQGEIVASFAVYGKVGGQPTITELDLVCQLSDLVSMVVTRARLEAELASERNRLDLLLEGTNMGVWRWRPQKGRGEVCDRARHLLGRPKADFGYEEFINRVHPDDTAALSETQSILFQSEGDYVEREFRYRRDEGGWVWLLGRAWVESRDDKGVPAQMLGTLQDITETKEHEERQQTLERLESLGELADGIAHDFNNVLVGVIGGVELAALSVDEDEPAAHELDLARAALVRARELTDTLATFARGRSPVAESIDVERLMSEVLRIVLAGSGVRSSLTAQSGLSTILGDQGQIRDVFSAVVRNARQAMEGVGNLNINVGNFMLSGRAELKPGQYVRVTISDDGPGIDPEDVNRVFDPYFTTDPRRAGLGLAVVHRIVTSHGGSVGVMSTPGEGATFDLLFPAAI